MTREACLSIDLLGMTVLLRGVVCAGSLSILRTRHEQLLRKILIEGHSSVYSGRTRGPRLSWRCSQSVGVRGSGMIGPERVAVGRCQPVAAARQEYGVVRCARLEDGSYRNRHDQCANGAQYRKLSPAVRFAERKMDLGGREGRGIRVAGCEVGFFSTFRRELRGPRASAILIVSRTLQDACLPLQLSLPFHDEGTDLRPI